MNYYFSKTLQISSFEEAVIKTKEALKKEEFGVIGEIDFQQNFKEKLGVDFRKYILLEACNPFYAYKSIMSEDKIGTLLPCNFIIQEIEGRIEVSSINPGTMMMQIDNPEMQQISKEVSEKLQRVIESL